MSLTCIAPFFYSFTVLIDYNELCIGQFLIGGEVTLADLYLSGVVFNSDSIYTAILAYSKCDVIDQHNGFAEMQSLLL